METSLHGKVYHKGLRAVTLHKLQFQNVCSVSRLQLLWKQKKVKCLQKKKTITQTTRTFIQTSAFLSRDDALQVRGAAFL